MQPTEPADGHQDETLDHSPISSESILKTLSQHIGPISQVLLRDTSPNEPPSPVIEPSSTEMPDPDFRSERLQLFGEIGRGGMGAVLKGRDPDLGRDVAVKVLLETHKDRKELVRRFVGEAQITGQLQHPNIVSVYELGTFKDRRPYFSMKLVKGRTLADLLRERPSPQSELARFLGIFQDICQALAYAHVRGVIHRDLKPSNIMVGAFGEVQVMDWGLAKVLPRGGIIDDAEAGIAEPPKDETVIATERTDADQSQIGSVMGTPSYMAPEQARGDIDTIDERADVFALGSILCEILTGEPAFTGRILGEIQRKAARGDTAEALSRLKKTKVDDDLLDLATLSLAVESLDRPRNAGVVAERISSYLASVQDRLRTAELERVRAEALAQEERKRRKLQAGLAASVLALMTLGGLAGFYGYQQRQERSSRVETALSEVEFLLKQARTHPEDPTMWTNVVTKLEAVKANVADLGDGRKTKRFASYEREAQDQRAIALKDRRLLERLSDIRSSHSDMSDFEIDSAYASAFLDAGFDIDNASHDKLAAEFQKRSKPTTAEMALYLDDWTAICHIAGTSKRSWKKPLAAARIADPEPFREKIRSALIIVDKTECRNSLNSLSKAIQDGKLAPATTILLAKELTWAGETKQAENVLRQAVLHQPSDIWLNYELGQRLNMGSRVSREEAAHFLGVARALRPTTSHDLAHLLDELGHGADSLVVFRDLVERHPQNGRDHTCMAFLLKKKGLNSEADRELEKGIVLLRELIQTHPDDSLSHVLLGSALESTGKLEEAISEYRLALQFQPDFANAHSYLGAALEKKGKLDEALAEFRLAIQFQPEDASAHSNLGVALAGTGKTEEAIAEYRLALQFQPDLANAHSNLGAALERKGKLEEAISEYRLALQFQPDLATAHCALGAALEKKGKLDEAISEYRLAIQFQPDFAGAHSNLGVALAGTGKTEEALAEFRLAIQFQPGLAEAHCALGVALAETGKTEEAISEYRLAIQFQPGLAEAHCALGVAFAGAGKAEEAISEYRLAIDFQPDFAEAHCNLGQTLKRLGRFSEAVAELRKFHELGSKIKNWQYPSAEWVKDAERLLKLSERLPSILRGSEKPTDNKERLALAQVAYDTQIFAASFKLFDEALCQESSLTDDREIQTAYSAACSAALAAACRGKGEPPLDEAGCVALRAKALEWLRVEFKAWSKLQETNKAEDRAILVNKVSHWKEDADLISIRDPDALAKLPEAERKEFVTLWTDVDVLLKKAAAK